MVNTILSNSARVVRKDFMPGSLILSTPYTDKQTGTRNDSRDAACFRLKVPRDAHKYTQAIDIHS
jgi:hypothetical protein